MILKAQMQTVGDRTVISGLRWYISDRYGLLIAVGGDFSQNIIIVYVIYYSLVWYLKGMGKK